MLTIKQCRNELTKNGDKHTDDEIIQIRDFFVEMSKSNDCLYCLQSFSKAPILELQRFFPSEYIGS